MSVSEVMRSRSVLRSVGPAPGLFASALQRDKALKDLCSRGGGVFRPFEELMSDVFTFFHEPFSLIKESGSGCDKLHFLVMKYLADAPEYAALRSRSAGKYEPSLAAAEEFGNRLLDHLFVQAIVGIGEHGIAAGEPIEIEKLVLADVAKIGGGASASSGVLVIAKRVEQAIDAAVVLGDVCHTFGIGPGEIRAMPWAQRANLAAVMENSSNLRRFADLLGRWSSLAVARRATRTPGVPEEYSDVTYGDDWHLFVPQELGALCNPATRYDFLIRLIDRKIVQYDPQSHEERGRGPIVVCVDTSGSMAGERDISAKAASLSLNSVARKQGRPFAAILFSSPNETMSFLFRDTSVVSRPASGEETRLTLLEGIMSAATLFFGGGTDYESPLREALRLIETGGPDWRDGDIVFITDDYCEVSDEFTENFRHEKNRLNFKVFSVIIGAKAEHARTLWKFSDRVLSADDLDENAVEQVFGAV